MITRWQGLLETYPLTVDQRAAFAPLLDARLMSTLPNLIEHAETHGLITFEEAAKLRGGQVIVDWDKIQSDYQPANIGGEQWH
ncbi:MAG: hypothetical protein ABIU05_00880 [Nitrospirales bacterium]